MHFLEDAHTGEFRREVRAFAEAKVPAWLKDKVMQGHRLEHADYKLWYDSLYEKGWITPAWPVEFGGTGWSAYERLVFDEECLLAGAPRVVASGIHMLGPVLIRFGSEAQKAQHLPPIRRTETWWAQGFSEPEAGSDLAAIRTTAVRTQTSEGQVFVLNGQKVWTSYAQWCDWMFCLARTASGGRAQEGISLFLVDLRTPGISVRPIPMIDGGTDLNEVILEDVHVPMANLVGEANGGWDIAKHLLSLERLGIAGIGSCKQQLIRAEAMLKNSRRTGDGHFRRRLTELTAQTLALEAMALRSIGTNQRVLFSGIQPSILKVHGTELRQELFDLIFDMSDGDASRPNPHMDKGHGLSPAAANLLDARKLTLYGGANEVQRNLIARAVLQ